MIWIEGEDRVPRSTSAISSIFIIFSLFLIYSIEFHLTIVRMGITEHCDEENLG